MPKKIKFIAVIILQVFVICGIAAYKFSISANGTDVVLRIRPVDPRDLLRGDYVTFQYDISNVYVYDATPNGARGANVADGTTVYVILEKDNFSGVWRYTKAQIKKPTKGEVFIKGVVDIGGMNQASGLASAQVHVIYGIEQFFIPEGKGQNVSFANKDAKALVAVDSSGNAVLKKLNVDGKVWP